MRLAIGASVVAAAIAIACASIDPPASFTKAEAGIDPSTIDAGPFDRCRVLPRRFVADAGAKVYGDPSGAQAVCLTLEIDVPRGGVGAVVFCVAGQLDQVRVPRVHDLSPDLGTCAYCTDVQTRCTDAGPGLDCETSYAPIAGQVRLVRLSGDAGDTVSVDIGGLVVARVVSRDEDAGSFVLEPIDCLFADGLTIQGVLTPASAVGCTGLEETACKIANTASSRIP